MTETRHSKLSGRLVRRALAVTAAAGGVALAAGLTAAAGTTGGAGAHARAAQTFSFQLKPSSPAISACLPNASGRVTITTGRLNDIMKVTVSGMPAHAGFDLFVIQQPTAPFGVSWYQSDVQAGATGRGSATVQGIFDAETFSVSPGGTVTFPPTHQFHLGLWFDNPQTPFNLGCEPGATTPVVTPFNGEQHAGIQVLNTAQFPVNKGPLSRVHR
jgi:hypothetical protein